MSYYPESTRHTHDAPFRSFIFSNYKAGATKWEDEKKKPQTPSTPISRYITALAWDLKKPGWGPVFIHLIWKSACLNSIPRPPTEL